MEQFFFRIEHKDRVNKQIQHLIFDKAPFVYICDGPWTNLDFYSSEEKYQIGLISMKRHLPKIMDADYNGPLDIEMYQKTEKLSRKYIFGCKSIKKIIKYFPQNLLTIFHRHDFVLKIYESKHIVHSSYQSAMDISKPFKKVAQHPLTNCMAQQNNNNSLWI